GTNAAWCTSGGTPVSCALGRSDGVAMEARIRWDAFGPNVTPKQFFWHVSSGNNTQIQSTVDNIGAPNGQVGSFFFRAVTLTPDHTGSVLSPGTVTYGHTLTNTGNATDTFDLVATSTLAARLDLLAGPAIA